VFVHPSRKFLLSYDPGRRCIINAKMEANSVGKPPAAQDPQETISAMRAEIPRLRRFARYMTRDADYADDLVQECLTRAIANITSWQPGTNLRAWLFVILKNVFRNDKRRAQHDIAYRNRLENDAPLVAKAGQYHHLVLAEVQEAFLHLSEDHREVCAMRRPQASSTFRSAPLSRACHARGPPCARS
jgi:RNA polymerase sigma factor (sigma-70 family)